MSTPGEVVGPSAAERELFGQILALGWDLAQLMERVPPPVAGCAGTLYAHGAVPGTPYGIRVVIVVDVEPRR